MFIFNLFEGQEFISILYCQVPPSKNKVYYYHHHHKGFAVLPYAQERIGRTLTTDPDSVQATKTINSIFPSPKQQDETDRASSGIVYKINCSQCDFVNYGQTERSLKTRVQNGCS